jgi:hypothetical protein
LNTLAIGASRTKNGSNPLYLFVRNTFTPQAATIGTVSYVTLDSRVIGFRPTNLRSTPIVPISISEVAWTSNPRIAIGGHNDRDDFRGTLKDGVSGNLCMLNFRQGNTVDVDVSEIIQQVKFGTFEAQIDVTDSNYLGPIVPTVVTQRFPAEITAPSGAEANQLVSAFNSIQGQRRIFPLHNPGTLAGDEITITGFVSATILGAHLNGSHLHIDLEPEFVLHPTAVTAPVYDDNTGPPEEVPENVYIHKLRLSR